MSLFGDYLFKPQNTLHRSASIQLCNLNKQKDRCILNMHQSIQVRFYFKQFQIKQIQNLVILIANCLKES
jgi:hypothetical protein